MTFRKFWRMLGAQLLIALIAFAVLFSIVFAVGVVSVISSSPPETILSDVETASGLGDGSAMALMALMALAVVLLMPLQIGFYKYTLDLWRGEKTSVHTLFSFYRRILHVLFTNLLSALLCGAVVLLPVIILIFFTSFATGITAVLDSGSVPWIALIAMAGFAGLEIWISVRLGFVNYVLALRPGLRAKDTVLNAWDVTRHKFWHIIGHEILLALPYLLFTILNNLLILSGSLPPAAYKILDVIRIIVMILLSHFVSFGMAGLANKLIIGYSSRFTWKNDTQRPVESLPSGEEQPDTSPTEPLPKKTDRK